MTRGFRADDATAEFVRHPSPWIIATTLAGRLDRSRRSGYFAADDVVLVAGMIIVFPFLEWVIHVFVLHWRPAGSDRSSGLLLSASTGAPCRPARRAGLHPGQCWHSW